MTSRELYEYALIELNKLEAPSLLLEDYNYFINKAVQQYINLVYAKLEVDQQSTDDIRVLKTSAVLDPVKLSKDTSATAKLANGMFKSSYYVILPADYLHLLNCIVEYKVEKSNFKCYDKGESVYFAARRLTPNMYTQVLNNAYMRPMYKRPYYYLNNINSSTSLATNTEMDKEILDNSGSTDPTKLSAYYTAKADLTTKEAAYKADPEDTVKKQAYEDALKVYKAALLAVREGGNKRDSQTEEGDRLSNPSTVRLELRFGNDDSVFVPNAVYVDYLKSPMYIRLTQDQINSTLDTSQILEFPDYVCFEIANIFVRLLMENASDPRLQTNIPLNKTIAVPGAEQGTSQQ